MKSYWFLGEDMMTTCGRGYRSAPTWLDALKYAHGPVGCIVDGDSPLASHDATRELRLFACECSERALKQARITDERLWNSPRTMRLWLDGQATDAEMYTVWAAAQSIRWAIDTSRTETTRARGWYNAERAAHLATRAAALCTMRSGLDSDAWNVARFAAEVAAEVAALSAAWYTTRSRARSAERRWQRACLDEIMKEWNNYLLEVMRGW